MDLADLLSAHRVVLLMDGRPSEPRCALSRRVVDAVMGYYPISSGGRAAAADAPFHHVDVPAAPDALRDALRAAVGGPALPQLFIDGEHVGGGEELMALHKSGELRSWFDLSGATAR